MANMQGAPASDEKQKTALESYGVDLTEIARTGSLTRSSGGMLKSAA